MDKSLAQIGKAYSGISESTSPLFEACRRNDIAMAQTAIAGGADVNEMNPARKTPLICAIENNDIAMVKLLLANGARPDLLGTFDLPLNIAITNGARDITDILMADKRVDINMGNKMRTSAIHCAAASGIYSIVDALIKRHANVNARDFRGKTPLTLAQDNSVSRIVIDLLKDSGAKP